MKIFLRYFIILGVLLGSINSKLLNACQYCDGLREECLMTRDGGGGASGKWLDQVTPKRGWTCTGAEDLGVGNTEECEMCEREQVRYIHHMIHGQRELLNLRVGCICSGHMEGYFEDPASINNAVRAAEIRSDDLKNRSTRRLNFQNLNGWKVSKNGNLYINKDHHHIIIIGGQFGGFSARVDGVLLQGWVATEELAKLTAFDRLWPPRIL